MPKIAIDIVLLPPKKIMGKAIDINNQLADDPIKLNKNNCLPHISLCMGAAEEADLPKIGKIIDEIGKKFSKISLTINEISAKRGCFEINKTNKLNNLHKAIMIKLLPYLSYDATTDMCFSPPPVVEKTLFWINNYKNKFSSGNFHPHITLGISKPKSQKLNINFTASKLAVCHLGNYCTCRKIFYSVNLV